MSLFKKLFKKEKTAEELYAPPADKDALLPVLPADDRTLKDVTPVYYDDKIIYFDLDDSENKIIAGLSTIYPELRTHDSHLQYDARRNFYRLIRGNKKEEF